MSESIVLLCSEGDSTRAVYNALNDEFASVTVLMEDEISRLQMAKRRAAMLGIIKTAGQVAFAAAVSPILNWAARDRIREIETEFRLRKEMPTECVIRIRNVNSTEAIEKLREIDPDVVVVNGTRIIGKETLSAVDVPFINTHAGITPLYRGVHGGYWALAEGRTDLVGTTVHLVDKGIDTGSIIAQSFFSVTKEDNFATYPYLHTAAGLPLLVQAVRDALNGTLKSGSSQLQLNSKLRYHPTAWQYVYIRVAKGVR